MDSRYLRCVQFCMGSGPGYSGLCFHVYLTINCCSFTNPPGEFSCGHFLQVCLTRLFHTHSSFFDILYIYMYAMIGNCPLPPTLHLKHQSSLFAQPYRQSLIHFKDIEQGTDKQPISMRELQNMRETKTDRKE